MSYLWGIGELVEDPSADLVRAIKEFLNKKKDRTQHVQMSDDCIKIETERTGKYTDSPARELLEAPLGVSTNDSPATTSASYISTSSHDKISTKTEVYTDMNATVMENDNSRVMVTCTKEVRKERKYRTRQIQTEQAFVEKRHLVACVQCCSLFGNVSDTGTSPRPAPACLDRGTHPSNILITSSNVATSSPQHKLCERHLKALNTLKTLHEYEEEVQNRTLFQRLKGKGIRLLKLLDAEKIQCIPTYEPFMEETIALYRCASIEKLAQAVQNEQMERQPMKSCLKSTSVNKISS